MEQELKGPATQFYFQWCDKRLGGKRETPFNIGTVWMINSVVIVTSKELWLDFLPKIPLSTSGPEWGLQEARLYYPSNPNPSIKEIVWKIRNSISHSDFEVKIGDLVSPWKILLKETVFTFKDSRSKKRFELEISMSDISKLNAAIYTTIQNVIEEYIKNKGAN